MKYIILIVCLFLFCFPAYAQENIACNEAQTSGIIEGDDGWLFRAKTDFQSGFSIDDELQKKIKELNEAFKKQDIQLVIALLPTRGMAHYKYNITEFKHDEAINSYYKLVEGIEHEGLHIAAIGNLKDIDNFYYKRDHHWNSNGARMMAQTVASKIKELSVYKILKKDNFKTDNVGMVLSPSSFLDKTCGKIDFEEDVEAYKTYSLNTDLFSKNEASQIVLLGTSNSDQEASKANFEGFLKEYLSADVSNYSISGGGFDSSMLQYLSSKKYANHKPKVIIWEFPVYQNFKDLDFYSQVIPAVLGGCSDNKIYSSNIDIKENKFSLLLDKPIFADEIYMKLDIPDLTKHKIRITVNYKNGERESFDFKRSKFYEVDGKFFLDLNKGKNIKSIEGLLPAGEYHNSEIKLCSY